MQKLGKAVTGKQEKNQKAPHSDARQEARIQIVAFFANHENLCHGRSSFLSAYLGAQEMLCGRSSYFTAYQE